MRLEVCLASLMLSSAVLAADPPKAAPPAPAPAQKVEKPSPAELKKAINYYYQGKAEGPILVELKACLKVDGAAAGATKSDCIEPVTGPVKKGTTVQAWVLFFVPEGGSYDDVFLQFSHEGQVRTTHDVKLTQAFRSRTWRPAALHKAGKWEIKVLRGKDELGKLELQVTE